MHLFQFLRLMDQENIYSRRMKNWKILSKMLFFATSTEFVAKDNNFTKGLPMLHCTDFVAYSYPGYELKYTDLIFMW